MPFVVVTLTAGPAVPGGEVTVSCVDDTYVNAAAALGPNITLVVGVKLVPMIVTTVPPDVGPLLGVIDVIVGALAFHVKSTCVHRARRPVTQHNGLGGCGVCR